MRTQLAMITILGCALAACGDDGGSGMVDAPPAIDASPDAPAALVGLGQRCNPQMGGADCPANAPGCLSAGGATGFCSPLCLMNGTLMTDAQGSVMTITPNPLDAAQASICTGAFTGTVGIPLCAQIINSGQLAYQPPHSPFMADMTYTNINFACLIACQNGACPTGLTPMGSGQTCRCQ